MKKLGKLLLPIALFAMLTACGPSESSSGPGISEDPTSNVDSSEPPGTSTGVHGITWQGVEETVIQLGDEFELLDGVKAYDGIDGELEVTIVDDDFFSPHYVSGYTIEYSATNSVGTTSTVLRTINVVKGVNVQNGAFAFGKAYWTFDQPGGSGTFSVVNEQAVISVTNAGAEAWSLQLYQTGIQFEANKTYELSFKAKSEYGRSVSAGFENVSNNYQMMVAGYQAVELTNEFMTYSVFATTTSAVGFVKAVVYLGQGLTVDSQASRTNPIDITIDDIRVREVSLASTDKRATFSNAGSVTVQTKDEFDALPLVTAVDYKGEDITSSIEIFGQAPISVNADTGMMLSYRVTDSEGNFSFINRRVGYKIAKANPYNLINSGFDNGMQGWIQDVNQTNGNGKADFAVTEGELTVDITNGSNDNWHIQLYQSNISLTKDRIYRTTVIAKASVNRTMTIEVSNPSASFAKLATDLVQLTTEYQTFVIEFKSNVSTNAKFSLLLAGQGANKVHVDYFENTQITAEEATTIDFRPYEDFEAINGDFKYGYYNWSKEATNGSIVTFEENTTEETVSLLVEQPGTADWHAQLSQDGRKFTANTNYVISIEIEATVATNLAIEAVNVGLGSTNNTTLIKQPISVTTSVSTFTAEFTPTVDYSLGKISLLLGRAAVSVITVHSFTVSLGN